MKEIKEIKEVKEVKEIKDPEQDDFEKFERVARETKANYGNVVAFTIPSEKKIRYYVFRPLNAGEFSLFKNRMARGATGGDFDLSGIEKDILSTCAIIKDDIDFLINHKPGMISQISAKITAFAGANEQIDFLEI